MIFGEKSYGYSKGGEFLPHFFIHKEQCHDGVVTVLGEDAHHIARSLRMAVGEHITVCDDEYEYDCELTSFDEDRRVIARVMAQASLRCEPPYRVTLYQALPKGDKLDTVIQKAVECGACDIVPFESEHCVVRMRADAEERKTERRNRIAREAAKQCGRGRLPVVHATVDFGEMLRRAAEADMVLFCYEGEGTHSLKALLQQRREQLLSLVGAPHIAVVIGSEGGFSPREAQAAVKAGFCMAGLGARILRTETASGFVLSCLTYEFELSST